MFVVEELEAPTESIKDLLSDIKDYEIVWFNDSKTEALYKIIEEKPDVVLLNIRMTGGRNLHFIYRVRAINEDAKIIILAGPTDGHYRRASEMLNVDNFLVKTLDMGKLHGILSEYAKSDIDAGG